MEVTLKNNSPKNKFTFVSTNGSENEYLSSKMISNSSDTQIIQLRLSGLTNWSDDISYWKMQFVESDENNNIISSSGSITINKISFLEVNVLDIVFAFNNNNKNMIEQIVNTILGR